MAYAGEKTVNGGGYYQAQAGLYYSISNSATSATITFYAVAKITSATTIGMPRGKANSASLGGVSVTPSGNVQIGSSYTSLTSTGTKTVTKTHSAQNVSWSYDLNVGTTNKNQRITNSGNISIGAKTSYTVSYNANNGSGAPSNQTKWHGETLTLSSTKPTRTGYTFKGWNTNSSGTGTNYSSGGSYTGNAALTLYANWQINTYSVTYNANGGSGAPGSQTKTYGTNLTLSSIKPTMVGYTFKGWATSLANAQAGTVNYESGGTYTGNAALTLYAVWELTYAKPKIENVIIERCTSTGTPDDEGSYAKVSFGWSVYRSDNPRYYGGSTSSLPYQSNAVDSCTVVVGSLSETLTLTGGSGTETVIIGNGGYNVDTVYTTTITITDTQTIVSDHTTTYIGSLATTFFPMDYNPDASAVGFFRPAPDNGDGMYLAKNLNIQEDIYFELDTNAASGTDHDLIAAITALGWTDLLT